MGYNVDYREIAMNRVKEKEIIQRFKEKVAQAVGGRLDRIVLFGSRSRGDAEEEPDFDFLILVKKWSADDKNRIRQAAWEISLEYDTVVTALVSSTEKFKEEHYFYLYENISKEGRTV